MGVPGASWAEDWLGRDVVLWGPSTQLQAEVVAQWGIWRAPSPLSASSRISSPSSSKSDTCPCLLTSAREDSTGDRERYQTVYAQERGSVAAPTAGLHFTPEILERLHRRGIETAEVTLHVGLGTFQPVRAEQVEDHKLHRESYRISPSAAAQINQAKALGRRIVAVGTTTVRTLEYAASLGDDRRIQAGGGEADIFIYPGYDFRVVGALLTNFHLPQSTLLMLVSALAGKDRVLDAYRHAVEAKYRFYSYGDCMFVE